MRPLRITTTRWHRPISSCISDEMTTTARPCCGERGDEAVDLLLGADIDAARRLVDDDDARLDQHHLGEQQLLLVAAGELPRQQIAAAGADVEIA